MTQTIQLDFYPVSTNRITRLCSSGVFKPNSARRFEQTVKYHAKQQVTAKLLGRLSVEIHLYPPSKHKRDIANAEKCLLDALQGIAFDNDNQIDRLLIERHPIIKGGKTIINISEINPNERNTACIPLELTSQPKID